MAKSKLQLSDEAITLLNALGKMFVVHGAAADVEAEAAETTAKPKGGKESAAAKKKRLAAEAAAAKSEVLTDEELGFVKDAAKASPMDQKKCVELMKQTFGVARVTELTSDQAAEFIVLLGAEDEDEDDDSGL